MDQERERIRERSGQDSDERLLLLQKSKRGVLNVIFGRTMLVVVLLAGQIALLISLFSSLRDIAPYYYGVMMLLYGGLILHLVNKTSEPTTKITWILLVVLAPAVGVALYLFVELDVGHRMLNRRLGELVRETAKHVSPGRALTDGEAQAAPELPGLSRYLWENGGYPLYGGDTAAEYLSSGEASLEAMLRDLQSAERFIFLEFFIIDEGYMWGRVLKVLEEKIQQGVEVRVMYDGTCALFRLPYRYPKMLEKLGVKCKMFSPIRPLMSAAYNNRDHRKILVVDGRVAYTGGVNLADEYINRKKRFGHWKDVSLRLEGAAVRSFTLMFLRMWNVDESGDDYARYLDAPVPGVEAPGWVLPYADSPLDGERVGERVYMDILNRAERYVHIMTPYLILDSEMLAALTFAARRGVEVVLLLPHIPDKKYAFALAKSHYAELLAAGVRILEYTPGFVHAKTFVSDDIKAVVGTINLDYRSLYLHFECAAYLRDLPAVGQVERDFQETWKQCQEIGPEDLKREKLVTRAAGWLLKVLAPVM